MSLSVLPLYDTTQTAASLLLYVPIHFIPEIDGCSKYPFPDQYVPILFILKGKGCIFKLMFPDYCV
jgi:hypothetical protein